MQVATIIQVEGNASHFLIQPLPQLSGKSLLWRMVERVRAARLVERVLVAAASNPEYDAIARHCEQTGLDCRRENSPDVLTRYYQIGLKLDVEAVAIIPATSPLIDPEIIDIVLSTFLERPDTFDAVSNLHPPSYPGGNDVEVIAMKALRMACNDDACNSNACNSDALNSIGKRGTAYFHENSNRFRTQNVTWSTGLDYSKSHRLTVENKDDFKFVTAVFEALYPHKPLFGINDILELLEKRPDNDTLNEKYLEMKLVGLSACPADAMQVVKTIADYVCESKGGYGAFRDLAELIIAA